MPFFSLPASKCSPLGNDVHREYLDSMVPLIRNGGAWPSCTSKVLTSGAVLAERQYASKVSWSQFAGTPSFSMLATRVSESRTSIRIVFFTEAALANMVTKRTPGSSAAILQILIKPAPPKTAERLSQTWLPQQS